MQQPKIIFFVLIVAVALAFAFIPWSNYSLLGKLLEPIMPADWENVSNRNIVENTVLLSLVEEKSDGCLVYSDRLSTMFDHEYFIASSEMQKQLQYNKDAQTLIVPCENMQDEQLRLHLRYITQEAPKDGTKYEYTFTEPNVMMRNLSNSTSP